MLLDESVKVDNVLAGIDHLIMSDIVEIVSIYPSLVDFPRGIRRNFVYPAALRDSFATFGMSHGGRRLVFGTLFV